MDIVPTRDVGRGIGVSEGIGVRVDVGVGDAVGVTVIVAVGNGVDVGESVGVAVACTPQAVSRRRWSSVTNWNLIRVIFASSRFGCLFNGIKTKFVPLSSCYIKLEFSRSRNNQRRRRFVKLFLHRLFESHRSTKPALEAWDEMMEK